MSKRKELETKVLGRLLDSYVTGEVHPQEDFELLVGRPNGYWKNPGNIDKEIKVAIDRLGHFPTQAELNKTGYSYLAAAISKNGGLFALKKRLGYELDSKPRQYWNNEQNVENELKATIQELGHFPSGKELSSLNKTSLAKAIPRFYGGFPQARIKFGFSLVRKERSNQSIEDIALEVSEIIERVGHFPTSQELREIDGGLLSIITKSYGGLVSLRERMGYKEETEKPKGYWQDWKNVEREIKDLERKIGHFPSIEDIRKNNLYSVYHAISKYHGGMTAVRERLGDQEGIRPMGYWQQWENVERELKDLESELGHFPTQTDLKKKRKGSLQVALSKYHGGIKNVRKRLGYVEEVRKPMAYWHNIENVKTELRKIIEIEGRFPTGRRLSALGQSGLSRAINLHGGFSELKRLFGEDQKKLHYGIWKSIEYAVSTAQGAMKENKWRELPGIETLRKRGYSSLAGSISKYHGGIKTFRELLNKRTTRKTEAQQLTSLLGEYSSGGRNE